MAEFLKGFFGGGPRARPSKVDETDEVVPLHLLDDLAGYRNTCVIWTLRFDEVLDADKLKDALWEVFEMDGWRKLGGRLHKTASGKLEIHIPRQFTAQRPPLRYSHAKEDMPMSAHPLASQLPRPTGKLETHPSPRHFKSFGVAPGAPDKFEDYLKDDEPQIALRVVNFIDGTLVSLVFLHTICDIMGFASWVSAWSLALSGKKDLIPPYMGFRDDPMAQLYNAPAPRTPYMLADRQLSGWRLGIWGFRFMLESLWSTPPESRSICLPDELVMALRKVAKDDLSKNAGQDGGTVPFISDGDIVTALASRMACEEWATLSDRSVTTMLGVDSRSRAPTVFHQDAAYVQNAAVGAYSFGSSTEILQTPLGQLALKYRNDLIAQMDLDQVIGLCRLNRESLEKTGNAVMFGDLSSVVAVVSNWSKAKFLDIVDFSAAVPTPASEKASAESGAKPGHPAYWQLQALGSSRFSPTVFGVEGRDAKGNMWLTGDMRPSTWLKFENYLKQVMERASVNFYGVQK